MAATLQLIPSHAALVYASVNSSTAHFHPPRLTPGINIFFEEMGKFPGVGTHKLSKCPGVGTKKEGKCPAPRIVTFEHPCSLLISK